MKTFSQFILENSYSAKSAAAGKDIDKPGKNFEKITDKAAKEYGSKEAGEKVAGAVLSKLRKEGTDQLEETLSANAPTGEWVNDFVKSDNPKFKGKSTKERIKMALGAAYAAKKGK